MRFASVSLVTLVVACSAPAPEPKAEPTLDAYVERELELAALPGAAAAVVKNGRVVFAKGYGFADVGKSVRATEETSFVVGSVSKTVTGTAVMQLVEEGKLSLDGDVNDHLPFKVRNPKWPDVKITLRMLLTHTSSIQESATRLVSLAQPGDPKTSLRELLEPYLVPGGATYAENESYGAQKPGEKFVYSNFGAALAALVAETVAGEPFADLCKKKIFAPLGMTGTSFRLADLDAARLATPYTWTPSKGQVANPQTSVPYYPSTALRTTARDLARFLAAIARGGELDGVRILRSETVGEMIRVQAKASAPSNDIFGQGFLWEHRPLHGRNVVGHGGSYYGASARMHLDPASGVGVIVIANGDIHLRIAVDREEQMQSWVNVESRLWTEAAKL